MSSKNDVFRALDDDTRRLILEELTDNAEQTLFELCTRLIMEHDVDMTRQGISNHLRVLEEAGLVASRRRGKYKVIEFAGVDHVEAIIDWLETLTGDDGDTQHEEC